MVEHPDQIVVEVPTGAAKHVKIVESAAKLADIVIRVSKERKQTTSTLMAVMPK